MQIRKHISSMSKDERKAVYAAIRSITAKGLDFNGLHLNQRYTDYNVTADDILAAIPTANIIEVSQKDTDVRVLIRDYAHQPNVVACISLRTGHVVTGWKNRTDDHHRTLKTAYTWTADLTQVLAAI